MNSTGTGRKILIVDDDRDFVEALAAYLGAEGYVVERAHSGREGLEAAQSARPDLILMDVVMAERTEGFFTVQQLRRLPELKQIPIFIVSSLYASVPGFRVTPERSWLAHDAFFPKPVDLPALLARIRAALGHEQPVAAGVEGGAP
jgi:two-component system, OmpR family, response regulator